jgi:hypothetical protein
MQNAFASGNWKNALKSNISIACGVFLGEGLIGDISSWHGVKHSLAIIGAAVLVNEIRRIKQWADSSNGVTQ